MIKIVSDIVNTDKTNLQLVGSLKDLLSESFEIICTLLEWVKSSTSEDLCTNYYLATASMMSDFLLDKLKEGENSENKEEDDEEYEDDENSEIRSIKIDMNALRESLEDYLKEQRGECEDNEDDQT